MANTRDSNDSRRDSDNRSQSASSSSSSNRSQSASNEGKDPVRVEAGKKAAETRGYESLAEAGRKGGEHSHDRDKNRSSGGSDRDRD